MFKSKKIICILFCFVVIFILCFGITADASTGHVFTVPMNRPATGDRQGYAEIFFINPTDGKTGVVVVAWSINQPYLGFDVYESVDFDRNITSHVSVEAYNSEVRFYPEITPYEYSAYMDWVAVYSNSYHSSGSLDFGEDVDGIAYVTFASGYKIFSVKVYGNAGLDKNYSSVYTDFSVLYSDTATIYNELLKASASLREITASNTKIQNDVSSILNYTGSIDSKLTQLNNMIYNAIGDMSSDIQANADKNASEIQKNDDENTDKIIQNEKELQEKEKTDASTTGGGGVNSILGEIPNDTDGVLNAFKKLTSSMIHNNTSCVLTFPGIKIPPLEPFTTKEILLLDKQNIDMKTAIELIPETYLKLIRALCDITIIVFCFKEMYSQLAFLFTAKGGGDSE